MGSVEQQEAFSKSSLQGANSKSSVTLIVGGPGVGKTSLALMIAQQCLQTSNRKFAYVQRNETPYKTGCFYQEKGLSLKLANNLYQKYPRLFDHTTASDALTVSQMSRVLPISMSSDRTYILDDVDSPKLIDEMLVKNDDSTAIVCLQDL